MSASAPDPESLRDDVLSGRHVRLDGVAAARLGVFLSEKRGALRAWFGNREAQRLGVDPQRLRLLLDRDVTRLDELIARQLDVLLRHPQLQRLEGSWRGLAWMLRGFDRSTRLKARVLSVRWDEIARDLGRAGGFDQSALFRLVYESEFGRAGGEPIGLLVLDHEVRHVPEPRAAGGGAPVDDVSVVADLAAVAAAAFAPAVLGVSPVLLGADRFADLALTQDIAAPLGQDDHARWRALANREDARFVCLALPRVLARSPWSGERAHANGLRYAQRAKDAEDRVWFSAAYAFAAIVARAFATHGWPADIRGVVPDRVGGGLVQGLPEEAFLLGPVTRWSRPSLEVAFTDKQEHDLAAGGFMPLNTLPYGEQAFAAVHSLQARVGDGAGRDPSAAVANRRLSAQINSMLCVSRFAHYVKVMGREMTGSYARASDIERRLQNWVSGYTNANSSPSADSRARYPLVSSRVTVSEHADRPGSFSCVIHLQPHHQLDDVSTTFRLVTNFTSPSSGDPGRGLAA